MDLGKVVGNIWATRKEDGLTGYKLLKVESENKGIYIAVDRIGAGVGDQVIVTKGAPASYIDKKLPVDALIIGIVDSHSKNEG